MNIPEKYRILESLLKNINYDYYKKMIYNPHSSFIGQWANAWLKLDKNNYVYDTPPKLQKTETNNGIVPDLGFYIYKKSDNRLSMNGILEVETGVDDNDINIDKYANMTNYIINKRNSLQNDNIDVKIKSNYQFVILHTQKVDKPYREKTKLQTIIEGYRNMDFNDMKNIVYVLVLTNFDRSLINNRTTIECETSISQGPYLTGAFDNTFIELRIENNYWNYDSIDKKFINKKSDFISNII